MPYICDLINIVLMAALRIISLNCHGYNFGTESYLRCKLNNVDVILLQETWLSDCTCGILENLDRDFSVFHSSAMEDKISKNIMHGRPFGGTAIIMRKNLAVRSSRVVTDNPRVTSVCLRSAVDSPDVVISSVYMPWNDRSIRQVSEFEATIGCLQSVVDRSMGCMFVYGGDFNVSENATNECSQLLHEFCRANNLQWLLYDNDRPNYTYHSDGNGHFSIIDYFICSPQLITASSLPEILYDGDNLSDHCAIHVALLTPVAVKTEYSRQYGYKLLWDKADIDGYRTDVNECLSNIHLPVEALLCNGTACCSETHYLNIENYYKSIATCLQVAAVNNVPTSKIGFQKHWWTPELDDLKQKCIDVTEIWKSAGKPRSGDINSARIRCKYLYKKAIKDAAELASVEFNDDLCDYLCKKDDVSFWKAWRKRYCSHSVKPTGLLNGVTGDENIRRVFTDHFSSLFHPNTPHVDLGFEEKTEQLLKNTSDAFTPFIDIGLVNACIRSLKSRKTPGHDGICNEHIIYCPTSLLVHISLLFSASLRHGYVPKDFCFGIIMPLLKTKHGDASKLDMYRGITFSCSFSKLFESVLSAVFDDWLTTDDLQYGFKKGSSCNHALITFKESVKYFVQKGSKVHCVSLDASKAFDKVLHHGLFVKLLNKGVPAVFVTLLRNWYKRMSCSVLWNNVLGDVFSVKCGVRQGGVLSPILFSIYVDDLISELRNSGFGLHIGCLFAGAILYADDIVLLSASCYGLQSLLNICVSFGIKWDIRFNPAKTQYVTFGGQSPRQFKPVINDTCLPGCTKLKYLGCVFTSITCEIDVSPAVGKYYAKFNNIMAVLSKYNNELAAVHLIKSYCLPSLLYGCEIWSLKKSSAHSVTVAWNNSFRKIFNCCWRENPKLLLFYCRTLPVLHGIDQRRILFYKKMKVHSSVLIRTIAKLCYNEILSVATKYGIMCTDLSANSIKNKIWHTFEVSVD